MATQNWFEDAFGFKESPFFDDTRAQLTLEHIRSSSPGWLCDAPDLLVHTGTGKSRRTHFVGPFETPSVLKLRDRLTTALRDPAFHIDDDLGSLTFCNMVGDAMELILDRRNAGSVFQVASQFNCLEMVNPTRTPEDGITSYCYDKTQGPACAIACPAATLYRNYLWPMGRGQAGGYAAQIDNAVDAARVLIEAGLGPSPWQMRNGYLLHAPDRAMADVAAALDADPELRARTRDALRVGVHWDTETGARWQSKGEAEDDESAEAARVCQVFCSAVPLAYVDEDSPRARTAMLPVADAALEAAFEATLLAAALLARARRARVRVFLSPVGGGAFGNSSDAVSAPTLLPAEISRSVEPVANALHRALRLVRGSPLDVALVHFQQLPPESHPYRQLERAGVAAQK